MATPIKMPTLGLTMEAGTITHWLKKVGDSVNKDEPLFTVETDKAENEVESPVAGTLLKIVVPEGQEVAVQKVIAYIGQAGEQVVEDGQPGDGAAPATTAPEPATAQPAAASAAAEAPASGERELRASPLARKIARELGVDLARIKGTGPQGRIQEADVHAAAAAQAAPAAVSAAAQPAAAAPVATQAASAAPAAASGELEPLNRIRRVTAERMAQSARTVARVTLFSEVDFEEAVRFRAHLKEEFDRRFGTKLTYDAMLVKACSIALRDYPILNAQWADGSVRRMAEVHVGVAVAVDEGLLVAVVRDADRKSLADVCRDLDRMAGLAKQGKLPVGDMSGSTFTITNLGGHGVDAFTPIVNPPEAAILGVGRIARRPAVVGDRVEPRYGAWLTLAFDHRVTDGAPAGDFLSRVQEVVEKPYLLVGV